MSLQGRVALITGASRGIGKAIALKLAANGVHIAAAAKTVDPDPRLEGTIGETAAACAARGPEALAIPMNVRNDEEVAKGVAAVIERFGRLDFAIHNAGALWWKPLEDTPVRKFDLVMDVNARGAYSLAYHAVPHLLKQGGHFLTMSPPIVSDAAGGKIAYIISKFGMTLVALGVAQEFAGKGVSANALWPETGIETAATHTFGLGDNAFWYKPELVADAAFEILRTPPGELSGSALLVMDVMKKAGITDLTGYRCDPDTEPPVIDLRMLPRAGGSDRRR